MYTGRNVSLSIIFPFAWRSVLFFLLYSGAISAVYALLNWRFIGIPFLPIGVIGTAVAFYVGFKNNSSYERLWEARRIWGSITNTSRGLAIYILDYIVPNNDMDEVEIQSWQQKLIHRHLAYINALRVQLRRNSVWDCNDAPSIAVVKRNTDFQNAPLLEELQKFISEAEAEFFFTRTNPATHILRQQSHDIRRLYEQGALDDFRHIELGRMLVDLYNQQGACERIKSFPFPRQYAFFSKVFVWLFILVLPFGLVAEFGRLGDTFVWLAVPFHIIISWVFNTMEIVGDTSENPFENGINDVPMTAICRNIEIDLREMLGETNVPSRITPTKNILM